MFNQEEKKVIFSGVLLCFFLLLLVFISDLRTENRSLKSRNESYIDEIEALKTEKIHLEAEISNYAEIYSDLKERKEELWYENTDLMFENFSYEMKIQYFSNRDMNRLSMEDLIEVAKVCEAEAGVGKEEGIKAVAKIIKNRVESDKYPNTYLGVISQSGQFEVYGNLPHSVNRDTLYLVMQVLLTDEAGVEDELSFHAYSGSGKGKVIDGNIFY